MKLFEIYNEAISKLSSHGILNPNLETRFLLEDVCRISINDLLIKRDQIIAQDHQDEFWNKIARRIKHEPIQYIIGKHDFWSYTFFTKHGVFIPRPETEGIIESLLDIYNENYKDKRVDILDLCSGCGNIAITVAKEIKKSNVSGVDISDEAIQLANINKADSRNVQFILGNLFSPFNEKENKFDFILSNPPYIKSNELNKLQKEVVEDEPLLALDGGVDGLIYLTEIILNAPKYLKTNGYLICEIGYEQGVEVLEIAKNFNKRVIKKDLSGLDRILIAKK
jgi:release factor glutamine methyltransferase